MTFTEADVERIVVEVIHRLRAMPGVDAGVNRRDHAATDRLDSPIAGEGLSRTFQRYGQVLSVEPPRVKLRIARAQVPRMLAEILAQHAVEDVVVEDPPLEEVIAAMFSHVQGD